MATPKSLGYYLPAEWDEHAATWLTFPCHEASFPGKMDRIVFPYMTFIKTISLGEKVKINVHNNNIKDRVIYLLKKFSIDNSKIELFIHPSDDVWCRDHGPAFLINPGAATDNKVIVDWDFNAWGGKYPHAKDNQITSLIAATLGLNVFSPGIVMEGGSVDVNGVGALLTSESCLLNHNRNPHLSRQKIEEYLIEYYGIDHIFWLSKGIAGDDTDGHIDDIARFIKADTVIAMTESDPNDINYRALNENLGLLRSFRLPGDKPLQIIEVPMPAPVFYRGQRLPASYANFYICNYAVVVPTFRCENDQVALDIFKKHFTDREVVGIDATDIVWGFGSFHCLSQQEPAVRGRGHGT